MLVELAHEQVQRSCWLAPGITLFIFMLFFGWTLGTKSFDWILILEWSLTVAITGYSFSTLFRCAITHQQGIILSVAAGRLVVKWELSAQLCIGTNNYENIVALMTEQIRRLCWLAAYITFFNIIKV